MTKKNLWVPLALCLALVAAAAGAWADDEGVVASTNSTALPAEGACGDAAGEGVVQEGLDLVLAPEGQERAFVCGTCSVAICQGQNLNTYCGSSEGRLKYCKSLLFMQCPGSSDFDCECTSSDPP